MICALLSWYDERPDWLWDTIASLPRIGVEHLVAVDGAYALFPNPRPSSHPHQAEVVRAACDSWGIGCTVQVPSQVWPSEMAKRSMLFALGETVTDPDDWYLVIDADEVVLPPDFDLRAALAATDHDVIEATLLREEFRPNVLQCGFAEQLGIGFPSVRDGRRSHQLRCLFRAIRGLRVRSNHYTYITPDGRQLWGDDPVPALYLEDLLIDHRNEQRDPIRREAALSYYDQRFQKAIETRSDGKAGQPDGVVQRARDPDHKPVPAGR